MVLGGLKPATTHIPGEGITSLKRGVTGGHDPIFPSSSLSYLAHASTTMRSVSFSRGWRSKPP
jgi:hypothetical protein